MCVFVFTFVDMWRRLCVWMCLVVRSVIAVYWSPAAWCLRNEGVSSVLLGASNTDQLMENIGAIQVSVFVCVCVSSYRGQSEVYLWECVLTCYIRRCIRAFHSLTAALVSQVHFSLLGSAAPSGALLYLVNKVNQVCLASGVGDKAAAISLSLDRMHHSNGLFWLVRVFLLSAYFVWLTRKNTSVCVLSSLLSLSVYDISVLKCYTYISQGPCWISFQCVLTSHTQNRPTTLKQKMRSYFYPKN